MRRGLGAALVVVMVIHVAVRPEHGWILLSACDIAALATAAGLVAGWNRWITVACLFQVAVGLPSFAIGVVTTYQLNPTGVVIHVVPAIIGAVVVARQGVPVHAALIAWSGYVLAMLAGYLFAPPALNVNFASRVWPPLEHVFLVPGSFQLSVIAVVGGLLKAGEVVTRRQLGGRPPKVPPEGS